MKEKTGRVKHETRHCKKKKKKFSEFQDTAIKTIQNKQR